MKEMAQTVGVLMAKPDKGARAAKPAPIKQETIKKEPLEQDPEKEAGE